MINDISFCLIFKISYFKWYDKCIINTSRYELSGVKSERHYSYCAKETHMNGHSHIDRENPLDPGRETALRLNDPSRGASFCKNEAREEPSGSSSHGGAITGMRTPMIVGGGRLSQPGA
jgi:hypothetical protein